MRIAFKKFLMILALSAVFFSCSQHEEAFVSDQHHRDNLNTLHKLNVQMRKQLAQYGTSENSALNLNIYFVTDDSIKTKHLADSLEKIGYRANLIHRSSKDEMLWVLAGTSGRVSMDSAALDNWTTSVCNLSYHYDCEFEGWNPVSE